MQKVDKSRFHFRCCIWCSVADDHRRLSRSVREQEAGFRKLFVFFEGHSTDSHTIALTSKSVFHFRLSSVWLVELSFTRSRRGSPALCFFTLVYWTAFSRLSLSSWRLSVYDGISVTRQSLMALFGVFAARKFNVEVDACCSVSLCTLSLSSFVCCMF